jgi:putative membrane protein
MTKFFIRLLINGFAFYAAVSLVGGITAVTANPVNYLLLAVIFGFLNALVKPLLKLLTCPFILLTLGLFTLLINTGLFYLTGWLGQQFDYGFYVSGFWAAFFGALVVSIIGMIGEMIFRDELKDSRRKKQSR